MPSAENSDFGDCVSCGARITLAPPVAGRCKACAEPFSRSFLEHAATTSSQYDSTCRRLAFQVLQAEARVAELLICTSDAHMAAAHDAHVKALTRVAELEADAQEHATQMSELRALAVNRLTRMQSYAATIERLRAALDRDTVRAEAPSPNEATVVVQRAIRLLRPSAGSDGESE